MLPLLTIVGGMLLIVSEGVALRLFGVLVWAPQLAVLTVVYVGLRRPFGQAAVATLLFAGVADVCWGGPRGYYALGLTATFFAAVALRARFGRFGAVQMALLVLPGVLLTDAVALTTLALFQRGASPVGSLFSISPVIAIWTAVVALPMVWVAMFVDRLIEQRGVGSL